MGGAFLRAVRQHAGIAAGEAIPASHARLDTLSSAHTFILYYLLVSYIAVSNLNIIRLMSLPAMMFALSLRGFLCLQSSYPIFLYSYFHIML